MPTRSTTTGEAIAGFQKHFAARWEETLPGWANPSRFDHYYWLAVNTRLGSRGSGVIRLGDVVTNASATI